MKKETKIARIVQSMNETARLIEKAEKGYRDSVTCLKMEIAENIELGNDKSANKCWVDYCNQDKKRVNELKAHMARLENMLAEIPNELRQRAYNEQQATYMLFKANVEVLKEQQAKIEQNYIKVHNIKNPDGTVPKASWWIDDDEIFNKMMDVLSPELDALEIHDAEKALRAAEDNLIKFGLSLMPKKYANERKILEDACFGLNGQYVHLDTRAKFIEKTMKLDIDTVA